MSEETRHNVTEWQPTQNQINFVKAMLEGEKAITVKSAADKAGVARQTPYIWFKDENFIKYFNNRRESVAKTWGGVVDKSLINKCIKGDINAIKLFYERFDDLSQKHELTGKDGGPIEVNDARATLIEKLTKKKE